MVTCAQSTGILPPPHVHRGKSGAVRALLSILLLSTFIPSKPAAGTEPSPPPMADVHLHFNWDQAEVLTAAEAVQRLEDNGVVFGVVSSKPPSLALELASAADGWIQAFFMPYLEPERKRDWFLDERVLPAAREALASGLYRGLGEMHLIVGFAPSLKAHHKAIDGLLELAVEFDVPLSMHVEAGSHAYFLPLCRRHPDARIFWAHAGGVLKPDRVASLMDACPNVWIDLSARDPMRYGGSLPITDVNGALLPDWERLIVTYQDRVMVGSDPFYRQDNLAWDEPNTGWDHLDEFIEFHRTWLSRLPQEVSRKIRLENARRFFRFDG